MSSNRHSTPCKAYLQREDDAVGPLRLPMKNPEQFIAQFNRVYGKLGLQILAVETEQKSVHKSSVSRDPS